MLQLIGVIDGLNVICSGSSTSAVSCTAQPLLGVIVTIDCPGESPVIESLFEFSVVEPLSHKKSAVTVGALSTME